MHSVEKRLRRIATEIGGDSFKMQSSIKDIAPDEIYLEELISECEIEFDIQLSFKEIQDLKQLKGLRNLIKEKMNG